MQCLTHNNIYKVEKISAYAFEEEKNLNSFLAKYDFERNFSEVLSWVLFTMFRVCLGTGVGVGTLDSTRRPFANHYNAFCLRNFQKNIRQF